MAKFIINWNAGYGATYEVVEADNHDEAMTLAYEQWNEDAQNNAEYGVEEYSDDLAEDYGVL